MQVIHLWLLGCCVAMLGACALPPSAEAPIRAHAPALHFRAQDTLNWEPVVFPGKLRTAFRRAHHAGRDCVQAESVGSASMLRQRLQIAPDQLGRLRFDWNVNHLLPGADMTASGRGDSPARLVLAFDGDRQKFSARDAMLSELTYALTGEDMPYATLMYVWSNTLPVDTVITHPRTSRVRKIVVESGPQRLRQWVRYERDVYADFERAFGERPGALLALGIMTDSDNTQSHAQAWYGDIQLSPAWPHRLSDLSR